MLEDIIYTVNLVLQGGNRPASFPTRREWETAAAAAVNVVAAIAFGDEAVRRRIYTCAQKRAAAWNGRGGREASVFAGRLFAAISAGDVRYDLSLDARQMRAAKDFCAAHCRKADGESVLRRLKDAAAKLSASGEPLEFSSGELEAIVPFGTDSITLRGHLSRLAAEQCGVQVLASDWTGTEKDFARLSRAKKPLVLWRCGNGLAAISHGGVVVAPGPFIRGFDADISEYYIFEANRRLAQEVRRLVAVTQKAVESGNADAAAESAKAVAHLLRAHFVVRRDGDAIIAESDDRLRQDRIILH